jgi:Carbohydrate esterase, sialic acid-specific acetylesterase
MRKPDSRLTRLVGCRTLALGLLVGALASCGVREYDHPPSADPVTPGVGGAGGAGAPIPARGTSPSQGGAAPGTGGSGPGTGGAAPGTGGPATGTGGSGGASGSGAPNGADAGPSPSNGGAVDAQPEAPGVRPPGGPPLSGITVMINGMAVPKEKAIVIIHIGHSNMSGRAQGPAELVPYFYDTDPHLWKYTKGGVWTLAKEWLNPDGAPDKNFPQGAGPGMALLRQALSLAPDAYVISIGNGQSLNNGGGCFNFRKGGLFFPQVMERAGELKGRVTFAGVFAMFGYDGRTNPRAQNGGYLECLKGLAADYRAELAEPNLPFVFGDYERGARDGFSPTCCGAPGVIAQLAKVPEAIPNAILVPTEGIPMQDNHHYNMAGHKLWSERAFAGLADLNLLPWASGN